MAKHTSKKLKVVKEEKKSTGTLSSVAGTALWTVLGAAAMAGVAWAAMNLVRHYLYIVSFWIFELMCGWVV